MIFTLPRQNDRFRRFNLICLIQPLRKDLAMDPLLRQWKLLQLIPRATNRASTAELKEKLEALAPDCAVDLRTIQRDLIRLSETFPITSDNKRPAGWYWPKEAAAFHLPGMDLTGALTFRMVELFLTPLLPRPCLAALGPHLRRAQRLITEAGGTAIGRWTQKVAVVPRNQPLLSPAVDAGVVQVIYEALLREKRFRADYRKKGEEAFRDYEISPLGVVVSEPVVYVVGTLWDYEDVLLFALHRFHSVELLDRAIQRPVGFDLHDFIAGGALGFGEMPGERLRLKARFTADAAEHLRETPLDDSQRISADANGWVTVESEVCDTPQLRWWLLGFGDQVVVLKPDVLREEIAAIATGMAGNYT